MKHWLSGIVLGISLAGCAPDSWALGRRRSCDGEPPAVTRCQPVMVMGVMTHFRCLDSDGVSYYSIPLNGGDAARTLVCKPAAHEERFMNWCLGIPEEPAYGLHSN